MLYMHVYNDIVNKIYSCKLIKGDKLPSIQKLAKTYNVGNNTIRRVIDMLYENKFIDRCERKASKIIFDFDNEENKEQMLCLIKDRTDIIIDTQNIGSIMLPSIIIEGAKKCNENDFYELDIMTDNLETSDLKKYIEICQAILGRILSKMNNSIIDSILSIVDISIIVPLILFNKKNYEISHLKESISLECKFFCDLIRNRDYVLLKNYILKVYFIMCNFINRFLNSFDKLDFKNTNNLIRNNNFHSNNNYLYISIASDMAEKILSGKYVKNDFLPSEKDICDIYNVSIITIRKSIKFLNELGLVKTINGKGSQIILNLKDLKETLFIKNIISKNLYGIFESIQFIYITTEDIVKYICKKKSLLNKELFYKKFEEQWNKENNYQFSFLILLNCIVQVINSNIANNIYLNLRKKLIWGIYLNDLEVSNDKFQIIHNMCLSAIESIDNENVFSSKLKELCEIIFKLIKQVCINSDLNFPDTII